MDDNIKYWLALNKVEGLGPVKTKKLLEQFGSVQKACAALGCPVLEMDQELAEAEKLNVQIMARDDPAYPENLQNIYDPPPILYVKGELKKTDQKAIAIVGTRQATQYGLESARKFSYLLAQMGITIVSGLALGIDTAAHQGALEAKGRTIAVLGSGVDQIYPATNRDLAKKIANSGAIMSEFSLGFMPDTWTFPQRNRIISGLSLGVIMVEGHYDSGAMITAKLALDQGREVFAVPGQIELDQSKGPHWLIKQGAKLVETVDDVLEELHIGLNLKTDNRESKIENRKLELSDEERKIVETLTRGPKHLDLIAQESNLTIPQVSSLLTQLEIKGAVRQTPGKRFVLY